jgi:hypothetical protein
MVVEAVGRSAGHVPLTMIPMFPYAGDPPEASGRFIFFQKILSDKFQELAVSFNNTAEAEYLARLSIRTFNDEAPLSLEDIRTCWEKAQALEIMHGIIVQRTDGYWVISRIYIGDLGGVYLDAKALKVELRISEREFGSIIDSHSLVTLFALAMDAKRCKLPPYYVLSLLAKAKDIYADILRRTGDSKPVDPDMFKTHEAILRACDDVGQRCK